jgi:hypothetical protein
MLRTMILSEEFTDSENYTLKITSPTAKSLSQDAIIGIVMGALTALGAVVAGFMIKKFYSTVIGESEDSLSI